MVRVGSLEDQEFLKKEVCDNKTGMTSEEQLRAIVSVVNGENPISDLTLKEIKSIYDGKIKGWSEL